VRRAARRNTLRSKGLRCIAGGWPCRSPACRADGPYVSRFFGVDEQGAKSLKASRNETYVANYCRSAKGKLATCGSPSGWSGGRLPKLLMYYRTSHCYRQSRRLNINYESIGALGKTFDLLWSFRPAYVSKANGASIKLLILTHLYFRRFRRRFENIFFLARP
jgi:hypothetical protein